MALLHVRNTWRDLGNCDTLMLHSADDDGSRWRVLPVAGQSTVELLNERSGRYLHVRESWERQPEGDQLMLHEATGNPGNRWELAPRNAGSVLLKSERAAGRVLCARQAEWESGKKGEMLALGVATERPTEHWHIEQIDASGWSLLRCTARAIPRRVKADVGPKQKFGADGHWQRFEGYSVVADLAEPARAWIFFHTHLRACRRRMLTACTDPNTPDGGPDRDAWDSSPRIRNQPSASAVGTPQNKEKGIRARHCSPAAAISSSARSPGAAPCRTRCRSRRCT